MMLVAVLLTACEKAMIDGSDDAVVKLTFQPTSQDLTRTTVTQFSKLNIQIFDKDGAKVFDKVKTQTKDDDDFCTLSVKLSDGTYTVVAVGHSSTISATIKSPTVCQFTASDGEKLTDTFCHCSTLTISGAGSYTLPMYRAGAMIQFCLTDSVVPESFAYFLMEYTGGSANFNPTTLEGITKSSQSEKRIRNDLMIHQAYTHHSSGSKIYDKPRSCCTDKFVALWVFHKEISEVEDSVCTFVPGLEHHVIPPFWVLVEYKFYS